MDDYTFKWEDFEEPTAPPAAEAQPPDEQEPATPATPSLESTPAPVAPEVQPERDPRSIPWDTIEPSPDYQVQPAALPAAAAGGEDATWSDVLTSPFRGARAGLGTAPDSVAGLADVMDDLTGAKVGESNAVSDITRDAAKYMAGDNTIRNKGFFSSFTDPSDFLNYLGETIGQAAGSSAAPLASGAAGGVLGSSAGPAGTAVGATAGALSANMVMGIGQMRNGLAEDPEIQKLLADGTLTRKQLAMYSISGGALIGGLEQFGSEKLMATAGVDTLLTKAVKQSLLKAIASNSLTEGFTETAQQVVQEVGTVLAGGDLDFAKRAMSVIESGIGGFFGGGGVGGGVHAITGGTKEEAKPGAPTPPANAPKDIPDPTQNDAANPAAPSGVIVDPAKPDISTPGTTGAQDAPPPALGTEPNPAEAVPQPVKEKLKLKPDDALLTPVVVGQGESSPEVAAALGGPTPVGVDETQAQPSAPPVTTRDVEEADALTAEDVEDYFSPAANAEAVLRIQEQRAKGAVAPAVPNADIAAVLAGTPATGQQNAQGAAPVPEVPQVANAPAPPAAGAPGGVSPLEGPTPLETANAPVAPPMGQIAPAPEVAPEVQPTTVPRSRRLAPQPAPALVETPAATLAPEPTAEVPQAVPSSPSAAVVQEAPAPMPEIIRPAPTPAPAERAPVEEPAPVAVKPKPTRAQAAAVGLRDAARAAIGEEAAAVDVNAAVDQAVVEHIADLAPGAAPGAVIKQHQESVTKRAREILAEQKGKAEAEEEAKTVSAFKRSKEQAKATEKSGTKKAKPAEAVKVEHRDTTQRAAEKEIAEAAKAKREPAPWATRFAEGYKELPGKGRGKKIEEKRKAANAKMEEARAMRAAAAPTSEAVKQAAPKRKSVERTEKAAAALKPVVEATDLDTPLRNTRKPYTAIRGIVTDFIARADAAYKAASVTPPTRLDKAHAPHENLYVFAKDVMEGRRGDMNPSDVYAGLLTLQRGGPQAIGELYDMMGESASLRGGISTEQLAAPEGITDETLERLDTLEAEDISGGVEGIAEGTEFAAESAGDEELQGRIEKKATADEHPAGITPSKTTSATEALNALGAERKVTGFGRLSAPFTIFRRMHIKKLKQLVGDVKVHIVSQEEMRRLYAQHGVTPGGYVTGSYTNYTDAMRAAGHQPAVYIDDLTASFDPETYANTLIHELTHAATSLAYRQNINGTRDIIDTLFNALRQQIGSDLVSKGMTRDEAMATMRREYGLTKPTEFIAEAYGNPSFQQILAQLRVPAKIAAQVRALTRGRSTPTWWDSFVATVQNAVGMHTLGGASTDYFSATIAVHPSVTLSSKTQSFLAKRAASKISDKEVPDSPLDIEPMLQKVINSGDAQYLKDFYAPGRIRSSLRLRLATTFGLMEQGDRAFGTADNPLRRWTEKFLKIGSRRRQLVEPGEEILGDVLKTLTPKEIEGVNDFTHAATLAQIDPRVPLNDPANKHVSKKGELDRWRRAAHDTLSSQWASMTPKQQDAVNRMTGHYQTLENNISRQTVKNMLEDMIEKYDSVKLPQGVTLEQAVDWVYEGHIDRKELEQTQFDKDMHAALGKHAESLAGTQGMRKIKGIYVPLVRNGKYVTSGVHEVKTPKGSVPLTKDKYNNQFVFHDKKALRAYQDTTSDQIQRVQSVWRDPATGERINPKEPQAVQEYVVTVQNRVVEMDDNINVLNRAAEEYKKLGYAMTTPALKADAFNTGSDVLPRQLQRMLNSVRQMQPDAGKPGEKTNSQKMREQAIVDAYIRQLSGSRVQHRRLKRGGVKGFNRNFAESFSRHNRMMAGYLANLEFGREMAKDEAELLKVQTKAEKLEFGKQPTLDTLRIGDIHREVSRRVNAVENSGYGDGKTSAMVNAVTGMTFITHLWSPTYSLINAYQPIATTLPELGKKHGNLRSFRMLNRALGIMGAGSSAWAGFRDSVSPKNFMGIFNGRQDFSRTMKSIGQYGDKGSIYNKIKAYKTSDGKDYGETMAKAIDELNAIGLGVDAGIETEVEQVGQNKAQRLLSRTQRLARAMPQVTEAMNRYISAIASIHLDLDAGVSPEQAIKNAVAVVEKTQGGYEKENNPAIFSNPVGAVALQFKKYAVMYGNLFGQNLADGFDRSLSPVERRQARKAALTMMMTTGAVAGAAGLPGMEIMKFAVLAFYGIGGMGDDDWESTVNWMQDLLTSLIGATAAEVVTHGLPRLGGVDLSNRMGADSLLTFGDPKSYEPNDVLAWIAKNMSGAAAGMAFDAYGKIRNGEYTDALTKFMPKWASDFYKAYNLAAEGDVTKKGRKVGEPYSIGDVVKQAAGFSPAEKEQRWEPGGANYKKQQEIKQRGKRTDAMGEWLNADPGDRPTIWKETIVPYNKGKTGRDRITKGDLMKNLRRRKTEERKAKREAAKEK